MSGAGGGQSLGEERAAVVRSFFLARGGFVAWRNPGHERAPIVEAWAVHGFLVLLLIDEWGWDAFVPADRTGGIAATLESLAAFLDGGQS
jgi:hypothetical protein